MDSGVGIDDQYLTTLYDEFSQESFGLARRFEGLGIGLSITERLIGMMGGTITAHSEKEGGSMFSITLPRVLAQSGTDQEKQPSLLVLERDRDEQRIFQYLLDPFCRVSFASDAERVLEEVSEGGCDGVLLNLDLCDNPADLVRRMRAFPGSSGTLLIGVSTKNLAGEREHVLAMGFDEHLFKPISKKALLNTMESLMALNQGHS
jgi:CheY-like chemotaxis protein